MLPSFRLIAQSSKVWKVYSSIVTASFLIIYVGEGSSGVSSVKESSEMSRMEETTEWTTLEVA